jgi:hypothetical protein
MTHDERHPIGTTDGRRTEVDDLLRWAESLPWVVARTPSTGMTVLAVDCPLLGIRRPWLVAGAAGGSHLAVIVPEGVAEAIVRLGWGRITMKMPEHRQYVKVLATVTSTDLSALVVSAYQGATS